MDVKKLREQIPALKNVIYMNTGWTGPSPRVVLDKIKERLEYEASEGPIAPHVYESRKAITDEMRKTVARFIGATPEEICQTGNTTEGFNIALTGFPWKAGDEAITCNLEHPSVLVPCYYLEKWHNVNLKLLKFETTETKESILEKLDKAITPRTRLIALSHIEYSTGIRLPAKEILAMAHSRGVRVLLDAAQAVGQIPVDVKAMDCDYYTFPGQKWLLGPEGVGTFYVRKELIGELVPSRVSFKSTKSWDWNKNMELNTTSAGRFELGTTSGPLWTGLIAAVGFIDSIGMAQIQERVRQLVSRLKTSLLEIPGLKLNTPLDPELSAGLVAFTVEGVETDAISNHLWQKARIVARSVRFPPAVRLSIAFFNTEEEIEKVVKLVGEMAPQKRR